MRESVYDFTTGMFQIVGFVMLFALPFILMHRVIGIFKWIIGRARGEKYAELQEETFDTYDRMKSTYYSGGKKAERDRYYAEMRGGRGYRGRQTRY